MSPGNSVVSPRSMTCASAGCATVDPTALIRSPSTRISPGEITRPVSTANSPAACNTTGWPSACAAASDTDAQLMLNDMQKAANVLYGVRMFRSPENELRLQGCRVGGQIDHVRLRQMGDNGLNSLRNLSRARASLESKERTEQISRNPARQWRPFQIRTALQGRTM